MLYVLGFSFEKNIIFTYMNLTTKILSRLAISGLFFFAGCSDDSSNEPNPEPTEKTCQLTGIGEVSDGDAYNTTYTYDAAGNLITRTDPDGTISFTYENNLLTALSFGDDTVIVSYNGNSLPYRLDFNEDGETYFYILRSENNRYITFENHFEENGESMLIDVTNITYDANGNVTSVVSEDYDPEMDMLFEVGSVQNITHDNQRNPYIKSPALMIYELLDGNEANLSVNNVVNYTYNYGSERDVSNSYTYNEEGYPTQREETGFSSPTYFNFSYSCN